MSNVPRRVQAPPSKTKSESDITNSPAHYDGNGRKRGIDGSNPSDPPRRAHRLNVGTERVVQKSPLHPNNQEKVTNKAGSGSPSWRKKVPPESGHGSTTPGRSRMGPTDSPPEKGATVPAFGDWNENDPAAGENLTGVFKLVRDERIQGSPRIPSFPKDQTNSHGRKKSDSSWFSWCFPWC